MTEIQFLANLLLEDSINADIKKTIVARIAEIETLRSAPITIPYVYPSLPPGIVQPIFIGPIDTCLHEYPNYWGGTGPASCTKCGKQAIFVPPFTVTSVLATNAVN